MRQAAQGQSELFQRARHPDDGAQHVPGYLGVGDADLCNAVRAPRGRYLAVRLEFHYSVGRKRAHGRQPAEEAEVVKELDLVVQAAVVGVPGLEVHPLQALQVRGGEAAVVVAQKEVPEDRAVV